VTGDKFVRRQECLVDGLVHIEITVGTKTPHKRKVPRHIDDTFRISYIPYMECEVEYTDVFERWWRTLTETEQEDVSATVELLEAKGPQLPFPYSSGVNSSKHSHMRELRIQHQGRPYRVLYAFDPRRVAILLTGGDKTGKARWYDENIPIADKLYDEHIRELKKEGLFSP